jgi:RimJ/RimL family protein N-acetyltransferase
MTMSYAIAAPEERHYHSLHQAMDVVAREKRFLSATQAPPFEQSAAFYRGLAADRMPHFVALDGERVVGWVDVSAMFGESKAHVGVLGIALLPEVRHRGLGAQLLAKAIDAAWQRGLTRIELTVRDDNLNARKLYERFGFEHEGVQRRASLVDGQYHDMHAMALLR